MNYEELLSSDDNLQSKAALLPLGFFHKTLAGGKYVNVVDLRKCCTDDLLFEKDIERELQANRAMVASFQLHFDFASDEGRLKVEGGHYATFSQLLFETPSLVGKANFVEDTISDILEAAETLAGKGIYHLCYAPGNVFARRGNNQLMLLSHGSFYLDLKHQDSFYGDMASYVAPEVIAHNKADERSEVFAIGKFVEWLLSTTGVPYEYKRCLAKAMAENPDDRYDTVASLRKDLQRRRAQKRTLLTVGVAAVVALVLVGGFMSMLPEPADIEYVKPAPKQSTDDLLDDGFDPTTELGVVSGDSLERMSPEKKKEMEAYEKKCEDIFRKRYAREADRILSKIYNSDYMGTNEKKFVAGSQATMDELVKMQGKIASEANLTDEKSQRIASEIIDKITETKKKTMTKYGIQK